MPHGMQHSYYIIPLNTPNPYCKSHTTSQELKSFLFSDTELLWTILTAYNLVSRAKKGTYSKTQNISERNGTQTYFSWMACWHSISNLSTLFVFSFQFHFLFVIDTCCAWAGQNLKSRTLKNHRVWFRNSEIPNNLCLNVLQFMHQRVISRNVPDTFKKQKNTPKKINQQNQAL